MTQRKSKPNPLARRSTRAAGPVRVEATTHRKASRKNIPTAELEAFAKDAETQPVPVLYPRDPSLDPQLVWKGKAEQDAHSLAVPSVPIYIQEKIAPRALIEDLRRESKRAGSEVQIDLFGDFNGLGFEQAIEFYQHDQHWSNRMILGDSLLVMTSLAEKEGLRGQVQTVYLDPPYGIKFASNWQVSTRKTEISDGKVEDVTRQPEQIRAFRDTWELGIHSYLAYLRDRLAAARELLAESGSVFVQIGDQNVHLVRNLLDEVFGSENYCAQIAVKKTSGATSELLPGTTDHLLWYARDIAQVKYRQLYRQKSVGGAGAGAYDHVEFADGTRRRILASEREDLSSLPPGARVFRYQILTSQSIGREKGEGAASWFPVSMGGREFRPPIQHRWKTNEKGMERLVASSRVAVTGNSLSYVRYIDDFPAFPLTDLWDDTQSGSAMDKSYVVQTSTKLVERCVLMTSDPGDLVLDPTCGSGTAAVVAEEWGRRWITIDTSRVALALSRTRLMTARFPFYVLKDSARGVEREAAFSGEIPTSPLRPSTDDIRQGFVYERIPHVTLKSIATNPTIDVSMTPSEVAAVIARNAETELLYDRPYIDTKTVRVTGPFTIESLSPHRVLDREENAAPPSTDNLVGKFVTLVLDNLRKAGVQNTVKNERLVFERLEPWPGVYVQASGEYTEGGKTKSVAVAIGPEYGTVGGDFVREAAKEAVKLADTLIVCGFAFDAHAQDVSELGRLIVLKAKMNPDLAMGDELLKKTGSGNLFMVFGEPDIDIRSESDGRYTVEIRGLDVYDPTTGQVRSHTTADIATWFIDTNYDGNSFFVRHAYFLGGDDPYEKLKRVLRTDVDESTWATLNRATSRPFPKPETGRIAVKVINHYGDEVLKVYQVS